MSSSHSLRSEGTLPTAGPAEAGQAHTLGDYKGAPEAGKGHRSLVQGYPAPMHPRRQ